MAMEKGKIENVEQGVAVTSTTKETPHPADESSAPGPYEGLELNRPPVSTNRPDVEIAQSLVAGAGAPTGPPEIDPSTYVAANAYVTKDDKVEHVGGEPAKAKDSSK